MFKTKTTQIILILLILISTSRCRAASGTDDIEALKKEIAALQAKVSQLERSQADNRSIIQNTASQQPVFNDEDIYDPFIQMDAIRNYMNSLITPASNNFPQSPGFGLANVHANSFAPGYDIKGTDKSYTITFDMPGMDKSKIDIQVKNNILVISGERTSEEKSNANHFYRQERSFGYFSKSIPLPKDAKADNIQAKYENGVLTVVIDKKEPSLNKENTAKKIEVK